MSNYIFMLRGGQFMLNEDGSSIQDKRIKYKPSRTGKIALGITIGSLSIALLSIILTLMNFGFIMIVVCIAFNTIALFSIPVLFIDIIKFNKLNNPNEKSDSKMIIYIVLGIVIGFMWGKIL